MTVGPVKITKISESLGLGADGKQRDELVITFNVGTFGPFNERFERTTFAAAAANTKLAAFASQLGTLQSAE